MRKLTTIILANIIFVVLDLTLDLDFSALISDPVSLFAYHVNYFEILVFIALLRNPYYIQCKNF